MNPDISVGDSVAGNWYEPGQVVDAGHRGVVVNFVVGGLVFWDWSSVAEFWTGKSGAWKIVLGS